MSSSDVESLPTPKAEELVPQTLDIELDKRAGLFASFGFAIDGLLRTLCTQRNMKIHWVSGLAVMLVGMALDITLASRASMLFCVSIVLCMEVLNTALEAFVDLHVKQYARTAMIAKDAAAAAVLVMAISSVVIFSDVIFHAWGMVASSSEAIIRTVTSGVPLLLLMGLILIVKRSVVFITLLGIVAIGLLSILAWFSRDEIFSLGGLGLVVGGLLMRAREPKLLAHQKS